MLCMWLMIMLLLKFKLYRNTLFTEETFIKAGSQYWPCCSMEVDSRKVPPKQAGKDICYDDRKRSQTSCADLCLRPFAVVEEPAFRELLSDLNPQCKVISRPTLQTRRQDAATRMKENLMSSLSKVSYVDTTTDWTMDKRSYSGVTVHWIEEETLERRSAILVCKRLRGAHLWCSSWCPWWRSLSVQQGGENYNTQWLKGSFSFIGQHNVFFYHLALETALIWPIYIMSDKALNCRVNVSFDISLSFGIISYKCRKQQSNFKMTKQH